VNRRPAGRYAFMRRGRPHMPRWVRCSDALNSRWSRGSQAGLIAG
jgi:hypothetical protein